MKSVEGNVQPGKHYRIGVKKPNAEELVSDDEMGLHVWNESRELVSNTLGGKAIPVFPRNRYQYSHEIGQRVQPAKSMTTRPTQLQSNFNHISMTPYET